MPKVKTEDHLLLMDYVHNFAGKLKDDEEILAVQGKIAYYESIIKYIDGVIKSIDNRGCDIRNATEWKKFEAGMV